MIRLKRRLYRSYTNLLTKYIKTIKPQTILEWGPGYSTLLMFKHSNAEIYTIEHDIYWYNYWKLRFADRPNIHLYHINLNENYVEAPISFPPVTYDLIFIDGHLLYRINCMKVAKNIISESGIIILHDCQKHRFKESRTILTLIEENNATCVFSK